jgi:uncharacterized protein (DUF2147 family)
MIPFPFCRGVVVRAALVLSGLALAPPCVWAQTAEAARSPANSPVGRWETFDDANGKMKSIVAIREENGVLEGTIETLFDPPVPHPTCYLCRGDKKDLPLVGLQVLWGFRPDGDEWSGGQVLDPETGKIYRASLELEDGGKKLRLHGYIGIPLLGRTQYWVKTE